MPYLGSMSEETDNGPKPGLDAELERKKVGRKLKRLRKALGYSNPDPFSYDNEINRSQYGKYEAGSEDFRFSTLVNLLNLHGIKLSEFFNDDYEEDI
jgi:transcriptional regulator with XRE-family HTH domain